MRLYQHFAQELQAEINWEVIVVMDRVESDDMARFGKARTAWEKELRDPDDVFIEAEERRRELARQAKKLAAKRKKRKTITEQRQRAKDEAPLMPSLYTHSKFSYFPKNPQDFRKEAGCPETTSQSERQTRL